MLLLALQAVSPLGGFAASEPGGGAASQPASAPASQPAGVLVVEGQVIDHIGAGVEGVEVRIFHGGENGRKEIGRATTDTMGDFKLHGRERVYGTLIASFHKTGYKPQEVEAESVEDELPPFIDYRLAGALTLKGTIRDSLKGEPVRGARITLRTAADEKSAESSASGEFEIEELMPGTVRTIIVAEGFAQWHERITLTEAPDRLDVRLEPERVVYLRITDAEGAPVEAAIVESLVRDTDDYRTLPSDRDGRLTLRGVSLKAAAIDLRISHPGFVSSFVFDRSVELPPDQTESTHTLSLTAAGAVVGKVISAESGKPLGGARLTAGESLEEAFATTYSGFDGVFALTGVPPGSAVVTVHMAEYAPALHVVEVQARQQAELTVRLGPASQVRGRVLDPDGKPVAGAHVMTAEWKGHGTLGLQAMTGEDGRFTLTDTPPEAFSLDVYAAGFQPLRGAAVTPGPAEHELKFTERRAARADALADELGPRDGEEAPAFEFTTLDGRTLRRDDLKGQWVLLDFWATWCGPCIFEMPALVAVQKEFGARKEFQLIGISLDRDEKALRKFVADRGVTWPQVQGDKAGATRTAEQFGVTGIPMTYLIGPDGKIAASGLRGERIAAELRKRLGKAP